MSNRIPHLLEPYVALPPPGTLTLLTSILGASSNWLILRHLYSLLKNPHTLPSASDALSSGEEDTSVGVILVSFLRDRTFWKDGCAKLGVDLESMTRAGRFRFMDGLGVEEGEIGGLGQEGVEGVRRRIEKAMGEVRCGRKVLVVDGVDALVAVTGGEISSQAIQTMLLQVREHAHSTIITLSADDPLLHTQQTTLEREHAALVTSLGHAADGWMGLRMLDTGVARDVSGVVRISRGEESALERDWEEREVLYHVGADGGVKVFERGT